MNTIVLFVLALTVAGVCLISLVTYTAAVIEWIAAHLARAARRLFIWLVAGGAAK